MDVVQRLRDPEEDREGLAARERLPMTAGRLEQCCEGRASHVLHCEEVRPFLGPEIEDLSDVRMAQPGEEAGLVQEHRDELGVVRQLREDPLQDDRPLDPFDPPHPREVDLRHAPNGDFANDLIGAYRVHDRTVEGIARGGLGHGRGSVC